MRAVSLLCLVLTTAVVQGYPVWKRDEGISETQAVNLEQNLLDAIVKKKKEEQTDGSTEKRDAFMADLQKAHDFEKKFSKDGQLHDHGLKTAQAVREFLKADKAWEAKKKGLKAQEYRSNEEEVGKRSAFMDDLLDSLQFEKRFSKYGDLSANEMKTAKALREYVEFAKEWSEKKGLFDDIFGDSSSSEEDSSSSDEDGDEEKKDDSSSSDEDSSSSDEDSKKREEEEEEDDSSSSDEDSSSSEEEERRLANRLYGLIEKNEKGSVADKKALELVNMLKSKKSDEDDSDSSDSDSSDSDDDDKKKKEGSSEEDDSSDSSDSDEDGKKKKDWFGQSLQLVKKTLTMLKKEDGEASSSDEDSDESDEEEERKRLVQESLAVYQQYLRDNKKDKKACSSSFGECKKDGDCCGKNAKCVKQMNLQYCLNA